MVENWDHLGRSLERLHVLLETRAKEEDWQQVLNEEPALVALGLPVKIPVDDVLPLARPAKTEPDIVLWPRESGTSKVYGIVELKGAAEPMVTVTRKTIVQLARGATTAKAQAIQNGKALSRRARRHPRARQLLASNPYLFAIVGHSEDTWAKLSTPKLVKKARKLLSGRVKLLHYDEFVRQIELRLDLEAGLRKTEFAELTQGRVAAAAEGASDRPAACARITTILEGAYVGDPEVDDPVALRARECLRASRWA